ncbi:phage minor head protein [Enterococcus sp. DIV0800]|uniref:phage minor head protein n=1 Tax=unclassified Enterococcus TaxID=2608891 RepID=UPI003D2FD116
MLHPELIYQYATTADEEDAFEILVILVAYFLSLFDAEQRIFIEDNNLDLPDDLFGQTRESFSMYITDLLINFRQRIQEEMRKPDKDGNLLDKAAVFLLVESQFETIRDSESVNAQQLAQFEVVTVVQQTIPAAKIYKTWIAKNDEDTCEICRALHGTTIPIDEPFLVAGQRVDLPSGKEFIYNYIDRYTCIAHPHDRCMIEFSIVY